MTDSNRTDSDTTDGGTALQLRTTVKKEGTIELSLAEVPIPKPGDDEVVVRVEAAPINPSDLGLLFGPADVSTARASGTPERPVVTADIPRKLMRIVAGRIEESMPAGNEGAGVVVDAGSSPEAQSLVGKTVGIVGGAMYAQYRTLNAMYVFQISQLHQIYHFLLLQSYTQIHILCKLILPH